MRITRSIAMIMAATLAAPTLALAGPQCFSPFSGVYIRFEQPVTPNSEARVGRTWGALASCDGLSSWPVAGYAYKSRTDGGFVFAFRAFTLDADSCGAVDYIGTLSGAPLSGPFNLFNQRTDFGNSGTMTEVACPAPPEEAKPPVGVDALGNSEKK
jgi:hypothetical protein